MTWWLLQNKIVTLFLGMGMLTTLHFPDKVQTVAYGGSKDELFIQKVNHDQTLVLKPQKDRIFSNLLVVTDKGEYTFYLEEKSASPHDFIKIKEGVVDSNFTVKVETPEYRILEGETSIRFENKLKTNVYVNREVVDKSSHFSKGAPIIYQNRRIYN